MGVTRLSEKELLYDFLRKSDLVFLHWAIRQVMTWKNSTPLPGLQHIHGTADRVFKASAIQQARFVKGGGHLMVVSRADQVSRLLMDALNN